MTPHVVSAAPFYEAESVPCTPIGGKTTGSDTNNDSKAESSNLTGGGNIPNSPFQVGLVTGRQISYGNANVRGNNQIDIRFRADKSGNANEMAFYASGGSHAQWNACNNKMTCIRQTNGGNPAVYDSFAAACMDNPSGCYSAGNGGTLVMQVYADDGTAEHRPTGSPLTTVTIDQPVTKWGFRSTFPRLQFPNSVKLTAGEYYHITFKNTAADPLRNWYSIDNYYGGSTADRSAANLNAQNASSFAVLSREGDTGKWNVASSPWHPIFSMGFTDGTSLGVGMKGTRAENGT